MIIDNQQLLLILQLAILGLVLYILFTYKPCKCPQEGIVVNPEWDTRKPTPKQQAQGHLVNPDHYDFGYQFQALEPDEELCDGEMMYDESTGTMQCVQ